MVVSASAAQSGHDGCPRPSSPGGALQHPHGAWARLREAGAAGRGLFSAFPEQYGCCGSIGQVYQAHLENGTRVAVKLLRQLASLAASTALGASYDLVCLANQLLDALNREMDFRIEAANTVRLQGVLERSSFLKQGMIKVPGVTQDLSSRRMLVLEWIDDHQLFTTKTQILS